MDDALLTGLTDGDRKSAPRLRGAPGRPLPDRSRGFAGNSAPGRRQLRARLREASDAIEAIRGGGGGVEQEDVVASYRGGVNEYVRKPVRFSGFAEAVRTLGIFWLLPDERPPDVVSPPD